MIYIVAVLISVFFAALVTGIKDRRYFKDEKHGVAEIFAKNKKFAIVTALIFAAVTVAGCIIFAYNEVAYWVMFRWLVLIYGTYILAYIDSKERLIPNKILLGLLIIRLAFLVYEIIISIDNIKLALVPFGLGALIMGGIIFVAMLISRNGVGMGDVKLFLVIGMFVGSTAALPTMFFTFFASAVVGIFMLSVKKAKLKDSMPMAPFALFGLTLNFIISFINFGSTV